MSGVLDFVTCGSGDGCSCALWRSCQFGQEERRQQRVESLACRDAVLVVLRGTRFLWSTEDDLQHGLDMVLREAGLPVEREVRLGPRDRIDLMVGRVGIEAKVKGDWHAVGRQVVRYCASDQVDAVVVVTNRPAHRHVPVRANGKPITVHLVGSTL